MSIVLVGSTSGSITLQEPAVAGSTVLSLPATTGTVLTSVSPSSDLPSSIKGPAFSAYATSNQTLTSNVFAKILYDTERYDTNNNFASSRFTPTVAGYYVISAGVGVGATTTGANMTLYKNGVEYQEMLAFSANVNCLVGNTQVYLNGTTDYVEIYARFVTGQNTFGNSQYTYFQGLMVRAG